MGWLFSTEPHCGKAALVARLRRPQSWTGGVTLVADRVVGNHYWAALRLPDGKVTIWLALMEKGSRREGYGYKSMDESAGLCCLDCPLSLLNLATEPTCNECAAAWRAQVREYHVERARRPETEADMQVSYGGNQYCLVSPAGRHFGWNVRRCSDGTMFRMSARQLLSALSA